MSKSQLPAARDEMIAQLADIGVKLKQAETIVVEGGENTAPDWFIFRLSRFTGHAIFVVPHDATRKTATIRSYGAAAGATCCANLPHRQPIFLARGGGRRQLLC